MGRISALPFVRPLPLERRLVTQNLLGIAAGRPLPLLFAGPQGGTPRPEGGWWRRALGFLNRPIGGEPVRPDRAYPRFVLREGTITMLPVGQSEVEVASAYSIKTTEREMADLVETLTFWKRKISKTLLPALSPDRSGRALLTITLCTEEITEVTFELQSGTEGGGVEFVSLRMPQRHRETLKAFLQDMRTAPLREATSAPAATGLSTEVMGQVRELARRLATAQRVVVLTGSGVSAESGIPTFRGAGGLWRHFDPTELASLQAFTDDPARIWEWYAYGQRMIATAQPNRAHQVLAQLARRIPEFMLLTQNVDGLHQKAGSPSVIELHGNIWDTRCTQCSHRSTLTRPPILLPPQCHDCGGLLRPDVVWFGEQLEPSLLAAAYSAAKKCELFIAVGTSGEIFPAATLVGVARDHRSTTAEITLEPPENAEMFDLHLRGRAGELLPLVLETISGVQR